jgi:hypothetical protein
MTFLAVLMSRLSSLKEFSPSSADDGIGSPGNRNETHSRALERNEGRKVADKARIEHKKLRRKMMKVGE